MSAVGITFPDKKFLPLRTFLYLCIGKILLQGLKHKLQALKHLLQALERKFQGLK